MKRLSIIAPHYKEEWEVCKSLLDSIALQQGVNLDDIEVIIVQDGEEGYEHIANNLSAEYPYEILIEIQEHRGVSAARNRGLDKATGEYVMFCDIDDMFLNNYGMHLLFSAMAEEVNAITSSFVEEQRDAEGNYKIIRRDNDSTFVHGKAYKRSFLIENNLRWNEALTIHEDGFFNALALVCAEDSKKTINTPFYLWKWNPNSTVRADSENYVLKTYKNLMDCRIAMAREFSKREYVNEFIDCVIKTVLDSYYDFNKPAYIDKENEKLVKRAERAFKRFYMEFKDTFNESATQRKAEIAYIARTNAFANGLLMESWTIKEWLEHIMKDV